MPANWNIAAEWEWLDVGPPEEKACFAAISIAAHGVFLTEGRDALANRLRKAPLLSGYHLAEWMAWNWWRLRWEPRSSAPDWVYSHRLSTIGGGYIWPNVTIFSDGERVALIAKSTSERPKTPFRYIVDFAAVIQASEFERGVDSFIDEVMQRLDSEEVRNTNLEVIWRAVLEERHFGAAANERKLEALLGREPDESDPVTLAQLIADADYLSRGAVEEMAAGRDAGGNVLTANELREMAETRGFDASPRDAVRLASSSGLPRYGEVAAWRLGAEVAKALREQEGLNGKPISDVQLAKMAGTQSAALSDRRGVEGISFALDESVQHGRVVLRSKWEAGRRFELARLMGDRAIGGKSGRLFPATRAYTYRQKLQRSFAAEFLSPFEFVDEMLQGDYSTENQLEVAQYFGVSEITIWTLLINHGRLERDDLNGELEASVA